MTKYSLNDIKEKVNELALKINVPINLLPSYGQQIWESHPYVKTDIFGCMSYIVSECGQKQIKKTYEINELLYWIFDDVTFSMARNYELKNRIEDKDSRRMIFEKQENLLRQLDESWGEIKKNSHQQILKFYPFDDLAGLRATFCGKLRKQGYSEVEIKKMANEKYPS
jgi:hypothetical protein